MNRIVILTLRRVLVVVALCLLGSGCAQEDESQPSSRGPLSGAISLDGSATLQPLSQLVTDTFQKSNPGVQVSVQSSGTGPGLQRFCAGEIDIAAASRPINASEIQACRARRVDFYELPMAFDSVSVVVNPANSFASCLTVAELKAMWSRATPEAAARWSQVRPSFPDQPFELIGPGKGSGTFDYFTLAINGAEGDGRTDYTVSDKPEELAARVAQNPNAIGYLGFAHYLSNRERLKLVGIDNGDGCVLPSAESVTTETYQPLARPVFIYASALAVARPEVKALARAFLSPDNAPTVHRLGYVPLPIASLLSIARHLDKDMTGTIFGGRGAVVGVTAELFEDDDRVRNALVR